MKDNGDSQATEFNPPAVILVRLVFLAMVVALVGAGGLLVAGGIAHQAGQIALGILFATAAFGSWGWLRRRGRLADVVAPTNIFDAGEQPGEDFARLVLAWEDLRVKRGTADFDAWELLRLRREIEARAKDDPLLTDYWRDHQG